MAGCHHVLLTAVCACASTAYGVRGHIGYENSDDTHLPDACQGQPARWEVTLAVSDGLLGATPGKIAPNAESALLSGELAVPG
jgi:hypothetical protein